MECIDGIYNMVGIPPDEQDEHRSEILTHLVNDFI
jgi:hypothetical protein